MKDYYNILGVPKNADQADIKKKFRQMAHECHPDKSKGDEKKFKEISEAYSVLGDKKKREAYDRGGIGAGDFNGQGFDFNNFSNAEGFNIDINDIFGDFFARAARKRGADVGIDVVISLKEAVLGTQKEINIPYKKKKSEKIKITIPANIMDNQRLILSGHGEPIEDGDRGDLYVVVRVTPDDHFRREGRYLIYDMPIPLSDSLLGIKKEVVSIEGKKLKISIPSGTAHGELLRIRHSGVREFLVRVAVIMPKKLSNKAKEAIETLKKEGL